MVVDFLTESTPFDSLPVTDAVFVFGHYDPRPALHAAELYRLRKAPKIVLCGKGRDMIPEGFPTEADYYASFLIKEGIPENDVILERESTNTLENVRLGMEACIEEGVSPRSLVLTAMPPLLRRACATFRKQFPEVAVYGSGFEMDEGDYMSEPRIKRLLGEFDRFKEYSEKGDIVAVDVPSEVLKGVSKLEALLS